MFKGRKPSRMIKLTIWRGKNLLCPLGVLRGMKDTGACTWIKNISNTVTSDYKYKSLLSSGRFVSNDRTCVPCAQLPTHSSPTGSKEPASSYPSYPWPHTPFWMAGEANLCLPLGCGSSEVCIFKPRTTAVMQVYKPIPFSLFVKQWSRIHWHPWVRTPLSASHKSIACRHR